MGNIPPTAITIEEATDQLIKRDATIRSLFERYGPVVLHRDPIDSDLDEVESAASDRAFSSLVETVTSQQLAGTAAAAIFGRISQSVGDKLSPNVILRLGQDGLRSTGLSGAKVEAIIGLGEAITRGDIFLDSLSTKSDDEVTAEITSLRGFGPWSAHMFLIFHLQRLNVWPSGDLGVRKGFAKVHEMAELPTARELEELGERYSPYRTIPAWYCWRVLDGN